MKSVNSSHVVCVFHTLLEGLSYSCKVGFITRKPREHTAANRQGRAAGDSGFAQVCPLCTPDTSLFYSTESWEHVLLVHRRTE